MEKLQGRNCILFAYHHVATTIFCKPDEDPQQPKDLLQLLPIVYTTCKPFVVIVYHL
jgi:hypothetical protein